MHLYTRKVTNKRWKTKEKLAYLIWSPSTGAHVQWGAAWFTTLQFLPKCHATFSTMPSTLAWIDQSPVSQRALLQPSSGYASTTVKASHMTQGKVEYESSILRGTDKGLDLWEAGDDAL
jgi:hypothetical protein